MEDTKLFSINSYVDTNNKGDINKNQKEQLQRIINHLSDSKINIYWLIDSNKIKVRHIFKILNNINSLCKDKGILVHNEIEVKNKTLSYFTKLLLKHIPITMYEDKKIDNNDIACLLYSNKPIGCSFNSCLGKTIYIKIDGKSSICPYSNGVSLKKIEEGDEIKDVYNTDSFKLLMINQIKKREKCKAECELFDLCLGGCPLDNCETECTILELLKTRNDEEKNNIEQKAKHLSNLYKG